MNPNVGYSSFDLSYNKKTMGNFADLIPIMCDEVVPGDVFTLGGQLLVESAPTVDVVRHDVMCDVYYYFVPYRILDENFEDFIKGGLHGSTIKTGTLPRWKPILSDYEGSATSKKLAESLWLQLGFPLISGLKLDKYYSEIPTQLGKVLPLTYPRDAYNMIYFYYYTQHIFDLPGEEKFKTWPLKEQEKIFKCNWYNDYFTTALPYRQRGAISSFPLTLDNTLSGILDLQFGSPPYVTSGVPILKQHAVWINDSIAYSQGRFTTLAMPGSGTAPDETPLTKASLNIGHQPNINISIDDFRTAIILQQYMELNTRSAEFYSDFIRKNFGVSTGDGRFQMPEYLGGTHTIVYFNEVTNLNGASGSQLGEKVANARAMHSDYITKFRAPEYGLIMGLLTIRPKNAYYGGINRQWLRELCTDFYLPSFAHLPFQEIYNSELVLPDDTSEVAKPFGYQGRYDEMRSKQDIVCFPLQKSLPHRTYSRAFSDTQIPKLGKSFIKCEVQNNNFALQNEAQFFIEYQNNIKAVRPMPAYSTPLTF